MVIAFNYGARDELARAMRRLAGEVAAGRLRPEEITAERISSTIDTAGIPDPDLIIRTSGEERLSNFLLWQGAYSELLFIPDLWPISRARHSLRRSNNMPAASADSAD